MREKNNTNLERMRELIERLTEADIAYYKNDAPIMTDLEYDRLTEELAALEHDTGLVLSGSPTQKVSGEILESLAEVRHTKPMLSAGKTKSIEDLIRFAAGRAVLLSWKMDGLTLVLRYEYGKLKQAITRGREGTALLSAGVTPDSFDFEEQRLAEAFRELPLMRRRILEMLFVEELAPSEIAAKLHCSVQHVYNQRSLAIKRLRERLIKERKNDRQ